jgi:hypothetical protein
MVKDAQRTEIYAVSPKAGGSVTDIRVALARSVAAGPHGRIVPGDNKRLGRWVRIEDAVGQDLCFAVYVRGDILALNRDGQNGVSATPSVVATTGSRVVIMYLNRASRVAWVYVQKCARPPPTENQYRETPANDGKGVGGSVQQYHLLERPVFFSANPRVSRRVP